MSHLAVISEVKKIHLLICNHSSKKEIKMVSQQLSEMNAIIFVQENLCACQNINGRTFASLRYIR